MKHSNFGWLLSILIVLALVLGGLAWEFLQRSRFRTESERLDAVVRAFQARAVLIGDDGKPLPLESGRTSLPYFELETGVLEAESASHALWSLQSSASPTWTLNAVFVDAKSLQYPVSVMIVLVQPRKLLLRSPMVVVFWTGSPPPSFRAQLLEALKDFDTGEAWVTP
jgi:hypothetical protein